MLFKRPPPVPRSSLEPSADDFDFDGARCPGLEKALHFVMRREHPDVLDLGPMCGSTIVFLAGLGARVTVCEFEPPAAPRRPGEKPLRIEQKNASFDLVLAWEQIDFMPPERLKEFASELRRVLTADGWLFLLSRARSSPKLGRRARFRVFERNMIAREPLDEAARPRFVHTSRAIEQALGGFLIEGMHLRRNQIREVVATRSGYDYSAFAVLGEPLQRVAEPAPDPNPWPPQELTRKPPRAARPKRPASATPQSKLK